MKKLTKLTLIAAMILPMASIAAVTNSDNSNITYMDFTPVAGTIIACVEQKRKDGTIVFPGVITRDEYKSKFSGFWYKDANTCAFWNKK